MVVCFVSYRGLCGSARDENESLDCGVDRFAGSPFFFLPKGWHPRRVAALCEQGFGAGYRDAWRRPSWRSAPPLFTDTARFVDRLKRTSHDEGRISVVEHDATERQS
jgi:hypothetical protein